MHTSATYTHEQAAEQISAFLRGKEIPTSRRRFRSPDHGPSAHWYQTLGRYLSSKDYRSVLALTGALVPAPFLELDAKGHAEAAREIDDYHQNGPYDMRGIVIIAGVAKKPAPPKTPRFEEETNPWDRITAA